MGLISPASSTSYNSLSYCDFLSTRLEIIRCYIVFLAEAGHHTRPKDSKRSMQRQFEAGKDSRIDIQEPRREIFIFGTDYFLIVSKDSCAERS